MRFFNHHSVLIVGALIFLGVASAILRRGNRPRDWLILAVTLAVYFGAWFAFRPVARLVPPEPGKALLLEVQSPYCFACVAAKPAVDRLEAEWRDRLVVRRVDIRSPEGRQLAREHRIEYTPTFILFDATGREQWRGAGGLDADRVRAVLAP
jgi:thiol-disulfide isomerase/thioredoxin